MSDTPRTDRRVIRQDPKMCGCCYKSEITYASHARQLERELAKITKQRDELLEALEDYIANGHSKALRERSKTIVVKVKGGAA